VTLLTVVLLAVGVVLLVVGAEFLVKGAASIASRIGVSPIVIGLTVVAFGTSAPELAVSVRAAILGSTDVAFGNVAGSNIANVLLILGASAAVGPLIVTQRIVRLDVPLVLLASVAVYLMALDNRIGTIDGALLFSAVILYTGLLIWGSRRESRDVSQEYAESVEEVEGRAAERPLPVQVLVAFGGFVGLVVGAQLLVTAATDVATQLGVSDLVIGLTVVAIGTSLPELATSMLAAFRGQRDIAVGNVVGSNLFNLLSVLGATAIVSPDGVVVRNSSLRLDLPVMLVATVVLLPIFWNGFVIRRWEGFVLLGFYATYLGYLILDAGDHDAATALGLAGLVAAPIVLGLFGVTGYQGWRRHRAQLAARGDR
jgi:cation:H+ antiporter